MQQSLVKNMAEVVRSYGRNHYHDNKRPVMSDLRDSGNIEQDADVIGFLYRDDYYNKETDKPGLLEIHILKHRNGPTGTTTVRYVKETGILHNIDWEKERMA